MRKTAAALALVLLVAPAALAGTISGNRGTANDVLTGSGETWDLTTARWTQSGYGGGDIPVRVKGDNLVVNGGTVEGDYPSSLTWWDLKNPGASTHANGAAFFVDQSSSGTTTFNRQKAKNIAVDMYRVTNAPTTMTFNRPYSETIRDDIFSFSRGSNTHYVINDAMVEGYTGISWRNTGQGRGTPFRLTINGMVMHIKPQALSSGSCGKWAGGGTGNGSPFKMDKFKGSTSLFQIKNTVIWLEEGNRDSCIHRWPEATWSNVTVVWTGPGELPGAVPAGVRVTRDKSVYDAARAAWFARG